ncbi:Uncharacterized protein FKW44_004341, partial [Caligus rogercresseyi]
EKQGNLEKELGPVPSTIKKRQCGNPRRTPEWPEPHAPEKPRDGTLQIPLIHRQRTEREERSDCCGVESFMEDDIELPACIRSSHPCKTRKAPAI